MITNQSDDIVSRIANAPVWTVALRLLTVTAFIYLSYIAFYYIQQPLVDAHAFRQTQTALTSYWMLKEGWTLAYQTPVAGFPWSIPFEFPIYQALVAGIVALSGFDLSAVGRFVSYLFVVACAWPAFAVSRRLSLPKNVPWVFCALLWTSPLMLYWGRTFMIETSALFFTLAFIPYAIDLIRHSGSWRSTLLFLVFATAAVLQKSTTAGPALLFMFLGIFFVSRQTLRDYKSLPRLLYPVIIISIPLAIGLAWAHYADLVKLANPFGSQLTSKALLHWNFGSLSQKTSLDTWEKIVGVRGFQWNAGGWFGLALLLLPWSWLGKREHHRFAWLSLSALILFILPILIFTNLHFIHDYYQVSCIPFLLAALAIVIGGWLKAVSGTMVIVPIATAGIMLSNIAIFNSHYGIIAEKQFDKVDYQQAKNDPSVRAYKVGQYLRKHTRPDTGLVIFGADWSSEIAFHAQRKSMTAPSWFHGYEDLWQNPQDYLGDVELGAIVLCSPSSKFPTMADLEQRIASEPLWLHESRYGCELLITAPAGTH